MKFCCDTAHVVVVFQAESTMLLTAGFWFMCRKYPLPPRARMAVNALFAMAMLQVKYHSACHLISQHTSIDLFYLQPTV